MRKAEPAGNLRASHFCSQCIQLRQNMSVKYSYSDIREMLKLNCNCCFFLITMPGNLCATENAVKKKSVGLLNLMSCQ